MCVCMYSYPHLTYLSQLKIYQCHHFTHSRIHPHTHTVIIYIIYMYMLNESTNE